MEGAEARKSHGGARISPFFVVLFKNGPAFPPQDLFLAPIAPIVPPGVPPCKLQALLPRPRSICRLRRGGWGGGGADPFPTGLLIRLVRTVHVHVQARYLTIQMLS